MTLSPSLKKAVSNVLAAYDAVDVRIDRGEPRGHANEAFKVLSALITKVGLDRTAHPNPWKASELTKEQRAVLTALTERRFVDVSSVCEVPGWWECRRWLGLSPPSVFERRFGSSMPKKLDSAIRALPATERIEAGVEALLRLHSLDAWFFEGLRRDAGHALEYARSTLPLLPRFATTASVPSPLAAVALFTAFSATGTTVPEGADERFPLSYRLPGEAQRISTGFLVEHLMAIAEPRRDEILARTIRRSQDGGTYQAAVFLLEHVGGLPNSTERVRRHLDAARKRGGTREEKAVIADLWRRLQALDAKPPEKKQPTKKPRTNQKKA